MKNILLYSIALALFSPLAFADNMTLANGDVVSYSQIRRKEPDGIVVMTDGGPTKIKFVKMTVEAQKKFDYDLTKATDFQAKLQADAVSRQKAAAQYEQKTLDDQRAAAGKQISDAEVMPPAHTVWKSPESDPVVGPLLSSTNAPEPMTLEKAQSASSPPTKSIAESIATFNPVEQPVGIRILIHLIGYVILSAILGVLYLVWKKARSFFVSGEKSLINIKQTNILMVGIIIFSCLVLFPPWKFNFDFEQLHMESPGSYEFIFTPPTPGQSLCYDQNNNKRWDLSFWRASIDLPRLLIPLGGIIVVFGALIIVFRDRQK